MTKKRSDPHRRPEKAGGRPKPDSPPPKRELIESVIKQALGMAPAEDSPQGRAEQYLHRAYESDDPRDVDYLARRALDAWPDCADAYVLLAEQANGPKAALDLYLQGVAAGERDLGDAAFRDHVGHFWLVMETRPYMRARLGMAMMLWILGRRAEAVEHYREMLRLNPNDNQGVRYLLAAAVIELGRDDELSDLIGRYPEDGSANWTFSAALLAFRREGDSPKARMLLAIAKKSNKYIVDLLTGAKPLPPGDPECVGRGDLSEATAYVSRFRHGWRTTPGALAWLRRDGVRGKPAPKRNDTAKGPTDAAKKRLQRLPAQEDVWQFDARRAPVWIKVDGQPRRPWIVLVVSRTYDLILAQELNEETPSLPFLWDKLTQAMESPAAGKRHRPTQIQVRQGAAAMALAKHLSDVGVPLREANDLDLADVIFEKMAEHIAGRPAKPGLLAMPRMTPELVASFYRAAADFYRDAPWERVGSTETIKIKCDRFESGPWYAVIIGQMGVTLGISLHEDYEALVRLRAGNEADGSHARELVATSVTYGEETETHPADLEASEIHGWEIAAPDAHPMVIRKERGRVMRAPLAWELRLLEACLRTIPDFARSHDRDDPSRYIREVSTGGGSLELELSWVTGVKDKDA